MADWSTGLGNSEAISKDMTTIYGPVAANSIQAMAGVFINHVQSNADNSRQSDVLFVGIRDGLADSARVGTIAVDNTTGANSTANSVAMGRIRVNKDGAALDDKGKMQLQINDAAGNAGVLINAAEFTTTGATFTSGDGEGYVLNLVPANGGSVTITNNNQSGGLVIDNTGAISLGTASLENLTLSTTGGAVSAANINVDNTANDATTINLQAQGNSLVSIVDGQGATRDLLTITSNDTNNTIDAEASLILGAATVAGITLTSSTATHALASTFSSTLTATGLATFNGGAVVNGNLTVSGTTTTVNTVTTTFEDPLLDLGVNASAQELTPNAGFRHKKTTQQVFTHVDYDGFNDLTNITVSAPNNTTASAAEVTITEPASGLAISEITGWWFVQYDSATSSTAVILGAGQVTGAVVGAGSTWTLTIDTTVTNGTTAAFTATANAYLSPGVDQFAVFKNSTERFTLGYGRQTGTPNSPDIQGYVDLQMGNELHMSGLGASTIQWNSGTNATNVGDLTFKDNAGASILIVKDGTSQIGVNSVVHTNGSSAIDVNGLSVDDTTAMTFDIDNASGYDFQISGTGSVLKADTTGVVLPTSMDVYADDTNLTFSVDNANTPIIIAELESAAGATRGLVVKNNYGLVLTGSDGGPCWQLIVDGDQTSSTLEFRRISGVGGDFTTAGTLRSTIS